MKNFKKVISAVVALALSVSSFAVVSASSFTDVADTAAYAEAVEVLSTMGIVGGYEDGSFKPEGSITRAEAAAMIVRALNQEADAQNAGTYSKFTDVNGTWAAPYVELGVSNGFIAGRTPTTFDPQANVTYAEMCKMLTKNIGYGDYLEEQTKNNPTEHWYDAYLTAASSAKINDGVQVSADVALTRAQVARMIWNTLQAPELGLDSYSSGLYTGNTYVPLDGKNRDFKTLLSDKFDGYVVTATITGSANSDNLDAGYANIEITKADWWDDAPVTSNDKAIPEEVLAEGIDADALLFQTGKAIIIDDEDADEYRLIYFAPTGKTEFKELAADSYVEQADTNEKLSDKGRIRFDSKYYQLADEVDLYVNGTKVDTFDPKNVDLEYIDATFGGAQGSIKLVKKDNAKDYNTIMVDYYEIAKVTSVNYRNGQARVDFTVANNAMNNKLNKIIVDDEAIEDNDIDLTVKLGDNKIALADLQKDDIIAIKADFSGVTTELKNPKSLTVLASRDTVTGTLSAMNEDDKSFTVDTTAYTCVDFDALNKDKSFEIREVYELTLDPFGRIFDYEASASSKLFGILEKYNTSSDTVTIMLADGSYKSYDIGTVDADLIKNVLYKSGSTKNDVQDRVVEYTVKTSSGALSKLAKATGKGETEEYTARTGKIGSLAVSSSTKILNAQKYIDNVNGSNSASLSDYKAVATSNLVDGTKYTAYGFNKIGTFYSFVLITSEGTAFGTGSRFAVVKNTFGYGSTSDGDKCFTLPVLYNGTDDEVLDVADDAKVKELDGSEVDFDKSTLSYGDAFFFETDSDGLVSNIYVVYDHSKFDFNKKTTPWSIASLSGKIEANDWTTEMAITNPLSDDDIQLVFGIVTDVASKSVTFGVVKDGKIDKNIEGSKTVAEGIYDFALASDCVIYNYDTAADETKEYKKLSTGSLLESNFDRFEDSDDVVTFEYAKDGACEYAQWALALIVDDDVVEIYQIQQ